MMEICFVVTNFNNSEYTELLLGSLDKSDARSSSVVVVDNASEESHRFKLDSLKKIYPNLDVIFNPVNSGYFPGLNIGIRRAREKFPEIKHFVVGNNDLIFPEDFVESIQRFSDDFLTYPVVSPNITMLDGTPQNPHVVLRISRFREFIYDLYHLNYYLAGLIVGLAKITHRLTDRDDEQQHDIAQEIYQGYGACYILGPKFFEHFESLWAPTFLMYEEFFLATQLAEKDFKTFYRPQIKVRHYCHASTGQLPGKKRWQLSKDAHQQYRKYVKFWH